MSSERLGELSSLPSSSIQAMSLRQISSLDVQSCPTSNRHAKISEFLPQAKIYKLSRAIYMRCRQRECGSVTLFVSTFVMSLKRPLDVILQLGLLM